MNYCLKDVFEALHQANDRSNDFIRIENFAFDDTRDAADNRDARLHHDCI
jgi:hypothetical protein